MVGIEALRAAIERTGLENLDGSAVRDALENMKDFDTGLAPPVSMNRDKPYVLNRLRVLQVQKGELVAVSDWMECPRIVKLP